MRRREDRDAVASVDDVILALHGHVLDIDRKHFPSRVANTRLDIFINADKQYRKNHREILAHHQSQ